MSINDFEVLEKLGKQFSSFFFNTLLTLCMLYLYQPGSGTFSEVFRVKRKEDGKVYALKKVSLEPLSIKERQNALNEVRILASIQHPCIIGYKEAFLEEQKYLDIVMDFANDGDLFQKITKYKKS